MAAATWIRPQTVQEAVLQELRRALLEGRYRPGDRLVVDQIAGELGVSAVPVREALRVLMAERRLQYEPHRGYTVTVLTYEEVEEIFLICRLLEAEAIRRGVPRMDEHAVRRMESLLAELGSLPQADSVWEKVALHRDFHFVPFEQAGLPMLVSELRALWDHTDHYRGLHFFAERASYWEMHREHERILEACAAGDAELVVRLMDTHRDHALAGVARQLGRGGAGGDDPGRRA